MMQKQEGRSSGDGRPDAGATPPTTETKKPGNKSESNLSLLLLDFLVSVRPVERTPNRPASGRRALLIS